MTPLRIIGEPPVNPPDAPVCECVDCIDAPGCDCSVACTCECCE